MTGILQDAKPMQISLTNHFSIWKLLFIKYYVPSTYLRTTDQILKLIKFVIHFKIWSKIAGIFMSVAVILERKNIYSFN